MHDLDTILDPDDRDAALERGFTQHDTLTFRGKRLIPLTIATYSVLQRAGNKLVTGGSDAPFADAAGFVLLHVADETENRRARSAVWRGREAWNEYVYAYLASDSTIAEDLFAAIPTFQKMVEDFVKSMTKSMSAAGVKKKSGAQAI
jgi:hypothetical protein